MYTVYVGTIIAQTFGLDLASISLSYYVIGHFSGKNRVKFGNFVNFSGNNLKSYVVNHYLVLFFIIIFGLGLGLNHQKLASASVSRFWPRLTYHWIIGTNSVFCLFRLNAIWQNNNSFSTVTSTWFFITHVIYRTRDIAGAVPFVRLSVHPSTTLRYGVKTAKHVVGILSSPRIANLDWRLYKTSLAESCLRYVTVRLSKLQHNWRCGLETVVAMPLGCFTICSVSCILAHNTLQSCRLVRWRQISVCAICKYVVSGDDLQQRSLRTIDGTAVWSWESTHLARSGDAWVIACR